MEQEKNEIAVKPQQAEVVSAFTSPVMFDHLQRVGRMFAQSAIVPAQYQMKSPDDVQALANCVIALDMANRMGMNPLMVMQNLYNVHGNPGWSSKFLIACLNGYVTSTMESRIRMNGVAARMRLIKRQAKNCAGRRSVSEWQRKRGGIASRAASGKRCLN